MAEGDKESNRTKIVIAIIGAVAVILAAIITSPILGRLFTDQSEEVIVTVRVADAETGESLAGAQVHLFSGNAVLNEFTNQSGIASFSIAPTNSNADLVVELPGYDIFDDTIALTGNPVERVPLRKQRDDSGRVIVRVTDSSNQSPIAGANVLLIVEGENQNPYVRTTDSNGIATFELAFPDKKVDALMSVTTEIYDIRDQNVILLPNTVQSVQLNPAAETLVVTGRVLPSSTFSPPTLATESSVPGLSAEITEVTRNQNALTIRLQFINSSQEDMTYFLTHRSYLLNNETLERYEVIERSTSTSERIPANGALPVWVKYRLSDGENPETVSLVLGEGILFERVEIPQS